MNQLNTLIEQLNYHQVRRMARTLRTPTPPADRIAEWRAAILEHWADPARTAQTIAHLPHPARTALCRLLSMRSAPRTLWLAEYGPLRLHRPRREAPSVAELLYERGLLYPAAGQSWQQASRLLIPSDLADRLRPLLTTPQDEPALLLTGAATAEEMDLPLHLLHDLSQLLLFCLTPGSLQAPALRWLKPTALRQFNQRLWRPQTLTVHTTQKQTAYLRLLSLLATVAGLLQQGQLTLAAWSWLAERPHTQWRTLVYAWREANPAQLAPFTRPDDSLPLPAPWASTLLHHLARQREPFTPALLVNQMLGERPELDRFWAAHFPSLQSLDQSVANVCAWPLTGLGLLAPVNAQQAAAPDLSPRPPDPHSDWHRLTTPGRWLLTPDAPNGSPAWRWRTAGAAHLLSVDDEQWLLWLRWDVQPLLAAHLACYAEFTGSERGEQELRHGLRITPHSVATAAANGHGLPTLLATLAQLDLTPTPQQQTQLLRWHEQGGWPRLALLPVLRTANRGQLAQLLADRQVAQHLGDPLNATTVPWHGEWEALVRRLRAAGFAPAMGLAAPAPAPVSDALHAGVLWLAAQLYTLLGRHLPMPFALPTALIDALYRQLDDLQQAQLHAQLEQLTDRFLALLDGLTPLPAPHLSDPARWQPVIEQAISSATPLDVRYWSAGRGVLTFRRLQPFRLFEQRGVLYLHAECLVSGRYQYYRLDRIQSARLVRRVEDQ
jgi:hypothetical protein